MTEIGVPQLVMAELATLLIAFVKGAFGGGFALVGIPLLSTVMDPISAGALIAPLFLPQDVIALWCFPPRTWSWPDLKVLVPSMVAGIGVGALALALLDTRLISIVIGLVSLSFAALWFKGGQTVGSVPRSTPLAILAGTASGVATMIAHSGSPPLNSYLLRLGLSKEVFVGTTTIYFAIGNAVKLGPWLILARPTPALWTLIALCVPMALGGVWIGWLAHQRIEQRRLYQACYVLLVITSLNLLWTGLRGYL
jgi:uncharacterized protein